MASCSFGGCLLTLPPLLDVCDPTSCSDSNKTCEIDSGGNVICVPAKRRRRDTAPARTTFTGMEVVTGSTNTVILAAGSSSDGPFVSKFVLADPPTYTWTTPLKALTVDTVPTIKVHTQGTKTIVLVAYAFPSSESASADIKRLDIDGKVTWTATITNLPAEKATSRLPIAVRCQGSSCSVLVSGPSTLKTASGTVSIDTWEIHNNFLASFDLETGSVTHLPSSSRPTFHPLFFFFLLFSPIGSRSCFQRWKPVTSGTSQRHQTETS